MSDGLGERMKENYEFRARSFLPRRTYTIVRVDGRAFHTYTRGLKRPFDFGFMADMEQTAVALMGEVSGSCFAYTQSDEISLLLQDFATIHTQPYFGGNVQKMCSVIAAVASVQFGDLRRARGHHGIPVFDCRVFTIPDPTEVYNYFVWRQKDATRNSISMAAQAQFSHRQCMHKSTAQLQDMLMTEKGINWNDYPVSAKRGALIAPVTAAQPVSWVDKMGGSHDEIVDSTSFQAVETPIFTQSAWLQEHIPAYG